ncbi:cell division protein SepF [Candidatus Woesearchaeota archaeon]|nr:cell division protein SepF [Candidatus Woesearchaeota archaeon]
MKSLFSLKKFAKKSSEDLEEGEGGEEYVEIDTEAEREKTSKIIVKPFVMEDFSDIKEILDSLREGYTIALINIKPLKDKDLVELKRAINKLKKTCDAIEGDIAGFGDDYVVVTPSFAEIFRTKSTNNIGEE